MLGKSTILRTGRMMSASSGSAYVPSGDDRGAAALAFSPAGVRLLSSSRFMSLPQPAQAESQAAVLQAPVDELVLAGGQRDAALEAAIGNLQSINDGALIRHGKRASAANDDGPGFEEDLEFIRRDAGKHDAEREPVAGFVEVDGRFPARRCSFSVPRSSSSASAHTHDRGSRYVMQSPWTQFARRQSPRLDP